MSNEDQSVSSQTTERETCKGCSTPAFCKAMDWCAKEDASSARQREAMYREAGYP